MKRVSLAVGVVVCFLLMSPEYSTAKNCPEGSLLTPEGTCAKEMPKPSIPVGSLPHHPSGPGGTSSVKSEGVCRGRLPSCLLQNSKEACKAPCIWEEEGFLFNCMKSQHSGTSEQKRALCFKKFALTECEKQEPKKDCSYLKKLSSDLLLPTCVKLLSPESLLICQGGGEASRLSQSQRSSACFNGLESLVLTCTGLSADKACPKGLVREANGMCNCPYGNTFHPQRLCVSGSSSGSEATSSPAAQ